MKKTTRKRINKVEPLEATPDSRGAYTFTYRDAVAWFSKLKRHVKDHDAVFITVDHKPQKSFYDKSTTRLIPYVSISEKQAKTLRLRQLEHEARKIREELNGREAFAG